MHISIVAEKIGEIAGWPITNSLLTTWASMVVIILLASLATRRLLLSPRGLQLIFENMYGFFVTLSENMLEKREWAEKAAPYIMTIFLFVVTGNLIGLLPGVGSIGFFRDETPTAHEGAPAEDGEHAVPAGESGEAEHTQAFVPLFRAPTADLNTTVALALISMVVVQIVGFKILGVGYVKKFLNFRRPIFINFLVGILELVSEFAKIISFSFRLFGNVFAGEVLLAVLAFLIPYFLPIPFYGLEIFVALVQAYVFSMLTLAFIKLATVSHADDEHHAPAYPPDSERAIVPA